MIILSHPLSPSLSLASSLSPSLSLSLSLSVSLSLSLSLPLPLSFPPSLFLTPLPSLICVRLHGYHPHLITCDYTVKETLWNRSEKVDHLACKYWCVLQGSRIINDKNMAQSR